MPRVAKLKPSAEEAGFLQAIHADPDSDIPRLVFADWLEERGHPRGTFIRLQCERAGLRPHEPRFKELLAQEAALFRQHEAEWSAPLQRHVQRLEFRRGFIHEITTTTTQFLKSADTLFRHAPIRSVIFANQFGADLGSLANCPHVARLAAIRFPYRMEGAPAGIATDSLRRFAQSPFVANLTELELNQGEFGAAGALALAQAPNLRGLRRLGVSACAIGSEGVAAFAASPHLSGLRMLFLVASRVDDDAAAALAAAQFRLHYLDMSANQLTSRGAGYLAQSPALAELRCLILHQNHITNLGVDALARSAHLKQLEHLDLSRNRINDSGVAALIEIARAPALQFLSIDGNEFGRAAIKRLAEDPECGRVRELAPSRVGGKGIPFSF